MNHALCRTWTVLLLCLLLSAGAAEEAASQSSPPDSTAKPNTLTEAERAEGWTLLFDGQSTKGWHSYGKDTVTGWTVEDGVLIALGEEGEAGGDLISNAQYESFELSLDWKLSPEGNSGFLFHVVEAPDTYGAASDTGPEYQLIDDEGYPQPLERWQKTGSNYAMHEAASVPTRPVGAWNHSRILVDGAHVEHWLNGEQVVSYELWTEDWRRRVQEGKWQDYPDYGKARQGHIALQDHNSKVWFRNVKIRPLNPDTEGN